MRTKGRCPHCGALVLVTRRRGKPAIIPPHACESRVCEYRACRARGLRDEMVPFDAEWYCPPHALLLAAKDLITYYRAEGDADWAEISEIIAEILPGIVAKLEGQARSSAGTDSKS